MPLPPTHSEPKPANVLRWMQADWPPAQALRLGLGLGALAALGLAVVDRAHVTGHSGATFGHEHHMMFAAAAASVAGLTLVGRASMLAAYAGFVGIYALVLPIALALHRPDFGGPEAALATMLLVQTAAVWALVALLLHATMGAVASWADRRLARSG